jgi:hypothetical protein
VFLKKKKNTKLAPVVYTPNLTGEEAIVPSPRNVLKNLEIILNVCYILMVLYTYLEFAFNVKSFRDIL